MFRRTPALVLTALVATLPAAAAPATDCAAIEGVTRLLAPARVLLFGELHGTVESPLFVGEVACHALAAGHAVTVALELPQKDQAQLDAFLHRGGKAADRELLYSRFWRKGYQDGRSSVAMADLVERLRRLRAAGSLEVVLIDRPEAREGRDQAMAGKLVEVVAAAPEGMVIALTGNIHNRTVPGARWNDAYEPMGYLLGQMLPHTDLLSLDVAHTGGTAWVCLSGEPCQTQKLGGRGTRDSFAATVFETPDERGFHGSYEVGAIHASLPAAATP